MKLAITTAALAAALAYAQPALAQGAYVGASAGRSSADFNCAGAITCDRSGSAWKLFGGYAFTPNFTLEGAWYTHGKSRVTATDVTLGDVTADYHGDGLALFGMLVAGYNERFSMFGKIGVVSARAKVDTQTSLQGAYGRSERHASAAWGVGVAYELMPMVGLRAEFERARVKFLDEKYNADMLTAGIVYRF